MRDEPPSRPGGPGEPAARQVAHLDRNLWRRIAEADTTEDFARAWLGLQARMVGGVTAGAVTLRENDGPPRPVAAWPERSAAHQRLAAAIERAGDERRGVVIRGEPSGAGDSSGEPHLHLAYPVLLGGELHGVTALEISPRPQTRLQAAMRQLQWGAAWLQNWALRHRPAASAAPGTALVDHVLELVARVLEEPGYRGAATALVTALASRLECDRVSLGFLKRGHVKVEALSHSAQFGKQMNLIRGIGMAMTEAVDQRRALVYPEISGGEGQQPIVQAHEQLARSHGDGAILTVPFVDHEGRAFGAITAERSVPEPFDATAQALADAVAAVAGPILEEKRRNDRWLITKVRDSLWDVVKKLFGPRHTLWKVVAAALLGLTLFLVFARGTYRVTAQTTLEGEVQRVVAAPFRGFVQEAPVRAGDVVEAGQVMCRLDERDLRLELSRWSSEREQYIAEHRKAMAEGERAAVSVLDKKMKQAEAQIELLQAQIERTRLTAPFAGLVVSGDLTQSLGAPVDEGEVLFEVAPLDSYRVMLKVDEGDIADVREGQQGDLILTALPEARIPFRVGRLTPVAISEEGVNYFLVEAHLGEVSGRLRPGMEGFGKIEVDERRLVWIWTHGLIDWARMKLWRWWP